MNPRFSLNTVLHVRSVAPAGLKRWQLKRHQIGLIDLKTGLTVSSAKPGKDKAYEFALGSPHTAPQDKFGDQKGVKLPITSQKITDVEKIVLFDQAVRERKPFIGYLGYDGVNDCEGLSFKCGTNYTLDVTIKGEPVRKVFGQNFYFEQIPFTTGCCDDCSTTESVAKALNAVRDAFYGGSYAHKLVDLDTVISCCPVPDPFPKVDFFDYSVSICDGGTDAALADIQGYYPTLDIKRTKYADGVSTYTTECVLSAPANYVVRLTQQTDCGDCPSGYTKTTAGNKYIVHIVNAGTGANAAQWLTEVQAAGAFSAATAANRIGRTDSTSIYEVTVPANFVEPTTAISNTTWSYAGPIEEYCRQTTASTFTWAQSGQSYKITRKLCATIKNPDCEDNATVLAALTKHFATVPDIVPNSLQLSKTNDCLSTYEIEQYSNCVVDGCDTVGADKAKFANLPAWEGEVWTMCACDGWTVDNDGCPVPPAPVDDPNCRGGLKFTGKIFDDDYIACVVSPLDAKQSEGVTVEVSIGDPSYYEGCTRPKAAWKVVQNPTLLNGIGFEYAKLEAATFNDKNVCYRDPSSSDGNLILGRSGEKPWTVELEKFYHHVSLYHKYHNVPNAAFMGDADRREQVMFVVEADKTELLNQVKTLVNSVASVQGITELI